MILISLTSFFALDNQNRIIEADGVVGELTTEQYEKAKEWIRQLGYWTDENREEGEQE